MGQMSIRDRQKMRLMSELSGRAGKTRTVSMNDLHEAVFGEPCGDKINGTRRLRSLITELRREGVPVCSVSTSEGGGYYLASAGSELEDYCARIRTQALKKLKMEANLRRVALPELLHQIQLNLDFSEEAANAQK